MNIATMYPAIHHDIIMYMAPCPNESDCGSGAMSVIFTPVVVAKICWNDVFTIIDA